MAQAITLNFTDARWTRVVAAYQAGADTGVTVNAAYVKAKLVSEVTARVTNYEQKVHDATFSQTSFAIT